MCIVPAAETEILWKLQGNSNSQPPASHRFKKWLICPYGKLYSTDTFPPYVHTRQNYKQQTLWRTNRSGTSACWLSENVCSVVQVSLWSNCRVLRCEAHLHVEQRWSWLVVPHTVCPIVGSSSGSFLFLSRDLGWKERLTVHIEHEGNLKAKTESFLQSCLVQSVSQKPAGWSKHRSEFWVMKWNQNASVSSC